MAKTRRKSGVRGRHHRAQMSLLMLLADLLGFGAAFGLVLLANRLLHFTIVGFTDVQFLIIPLVCLTLFMSSRLYPCVGVNPADEIKMVTQFTGASFVVGTVFFGVIPLHWRPNIPALAGLWALSVICVLLSRWGVRILAAQLGLWGEPVVVLMNGPQAVATARYFCHRRRLGFMPVLVTTDAAEVTCDGYSVATISLDEVLNSEKDRFVRQGIETVMVDLSGVAGFAESGSMKKLQSLFGRVISLSSGDWLQGTSVRINDFEGIVGISAHKNVLGALDQLLKRGLDILASLVLGVILLPACLAVALLIKLDSPGPAFYIQERIGKGGRKIKICKFRSMVGDAESALRGYLRGNGEPRREWDQNQKLRDDPRITRIGRILRKYSLDEFPQLLNVLKGDMSLVGPRPLPDYHYNLLSEDLRALRQTVRPGMTGMWQVSGRSDAGTQGMETWDSYYVHNWSLWLDFYILLRTVWVVLHRDGAY